ncbi:MAG TPA: alkaline phosphatase PhoX [Chloroflexota bacterium]|nr:alkaline phosphatase PhoX [Chloroflexota bacterium]
MKNPLRTAAGAAIAALAVAGSALAGPDFGQHQERQLQAHAMAEFGIAGPLEESSSRSITAEQAAADPLALVTLAPPLRARVVTSGAAGKSIDMIALWPNDADPTHLIACNEEGPNEPGLQRIELRSGQVETILTGTTSCDPVRRTAWGTILFAEEAGGGPSGGRVYELIDPLATTGVVLDRATGAFTGGVGAEHFAVRPALGRLSFEGFALYPSGLTYYGDEQRPANGAPGGAYFKFVPTSPRPPGAPPVASLDQSPLAAGAVYGLRVGRRGGFTDYGQGTQLGFGRWVPVPPSPEPDLRAQAVALKLTGYYRPEDIDVDRRAEAEGRVRFCANNTGNEGDDQYYGETICITDGTLAEATANAATPEVQLLVVGSPAFAMPDNIAYQPDRGNWVIHEDADPTHLAPHNDDLWSCLPDGADADLLSDGCVRIATLNDLTAEWTGGVFDQSGKRFFVSVQHNVTGKGVVLEITGWR